MSMAEPRISGSGGSGAGGGGAGKSGLVGRSVQHLVSKGAGAVQHFIRQRCVRVSVAVHGMEVDYSPNRKPRLRDKKAPILLNVSESHNKTWRSKDIPEHFVVQDTHSHNTYSQFYHL